MFRLLKTLLPLSFSVENWQSTIRHFVCVHEDYQDVKLWRGKETADIVFDDSYSVLTKHLINTGYMQSYVWRDKNPRYYIEVKTTTGKCDTPFFMSNAQVKRVSFFPFLFR